MYQGRGRRDGGLYVLPGNLSVFKIIEVFIYFFFKFRFNTALYSLLIPWAATAG